MLKKLPKKIKIVEVGPRDGLQNESLILKTEDKLSYIEMLVASGLGTIEATSFVRADKIPQMKDARELFLKLKTHSFFAEKSFPCLVPNLKGLAEAQSVGVEEIAVFTATSDSFNLKNINATTEQSLERLALVMHEAQGANIKIRAYVSTVFGCPYEGKTSLDSLLKVTDKLLKLGAYEISLGDTIGVGHPKQVLDILTGLKKHFDLDKLALHFHDTRGMAVANVLTAIDAGISTFDASSGGLGGCPYATGATGNLATEDLVYLCQGLGIETGVSIERLAKASLFILEKLGKKTTSKFLQAYLSSQPNE